MTSQIFEGLVDNVQNDWTGAEAFVLLNLQDVGKVIGDSIEDFSDTTTPALNRLLRISNTEE